MSVKPRVDKAGGREPKEHSLNLNDEARSPPPSSGLSREDRYADTATSPISLDKSRLIDIMDINEKNTKDVLEKAKIKLVEACSVLEADYKTVMAAVNQVKTIEERAANVDFDCEVIKFSVGGHMFDTSIETIKRFPNSLFAQVLLGKGNVKKNSDGSYFFDRDGTHFRHILNYMRHGSVPCYLSQQCKHELLLEVEFYGINSLADQINGTSGASAKNNYPLHGSESTIGQVSNPLHSQALVDDAVAMVNKACLSLESDITKINTTQNQRYKASLSMPNGSNEVVKLNVGGVFFQTTLATLIKDADSLLASLVTGKLDSHQCDDGFYYLDRDGTRFKHILNFLRDGMIPDKVFCEMGEELLIEANFFEINSLKKALGLLINKRVTNELRDEDQVAASLDVDPRCREVTGNAAKKLDLTLRDGLEDKLQTIFESNSNKVIKETEECYINLSNKLDSLKNELDIYISQNRSYAKEIAADTMKKIDVCFERSNEKEKKRNDTCAKEGHFEIEKACKELKGLLEKYNQLSNCQSNEAAKFKEHIDDAFKRCRNAADCDNANNTTKMEECIRTALQSAFEGYEQRMQLEMEVHNSPNFCAFSKSLILQGCNEYKEHLHRFLIDTGNTGIIKLIFSWNGQGPSNFHPFCDNKPPTLILVKTKTGNIFGGFTTRFWNLDNSELLFKSLFSFLTFAFTIHI